MNYILGNCDGKPILAEMPDPHRGRIIRAHYIDSDTKVQLHDGTDTWIITVGSCLPAMKLEEKIAAHKAGSLTHVRPRRQVIDDVTTIHRRPVPARRRAHVE